MAVGAIILGIWLKTLQSVAPNAQNCLFRRWLQHSIVWSNDYIAHFRRDTLQMFPSIPTGMLISWKSVQKLNTISQDHTAQTRVTTAVDELTVEGLISEFPLVFDRQVREMAGETFRIHLKGNVKPFFVSSPRSLRYLPFTVAW